MDVEMNRPGGTMVAITIDGIALVSTDGRNWQRHTIGIGQGTIHGFAGGPPGFVTATSSADGRVYFSENGVQWREVHRGNGRYGYGAMFYDGNNYLIGGFGHMLVSSNGSQWSTVNLPLNKPVGKSAAGNGVVVSVIGDGAGVFVSSSTGNASGRNSTSDVQPATNQNSIGGIAGSSGGKLSVLRHNAVLNDQQKMEMIPLTLMHNGNLEFNFTLANTLNFEGLRLIDSDGKTVLQGEGPGTHRKFRIERLRAGNYFLFVQKDTRSSYSGAYAVEGYLEVIGPWAENEPDDTKEAAKGLGYGGSARGILGLRGQGTTDDNFDWYQFQLRQEADVIIRVTSSGRTNNEVIREHDGNLNLYGGVVVYAADGTTLKYGMRQVPGTDVRHELKNLPAGVYYLQISRDTRPMYWGTYTVELSAN